MEESGLHEEHVSAFGVCGNGTGNGSEAIGVEDCFLTPHELGQLLFQVNVNIYTQERKYIAISSL